ncbi:MAG: HAD family hydrolase [Sulfobacillus thermosulfidooxidans]|nr:MAG: HAD family hydrolase [Sulfobacillus thermosulfidooxidans]
MAPGAVLLFDLDGTILDTTELILASFVYTFKEGLGETVSREQILQHFGRSLDDQFRIMRPNLSGEEIDRLVALYRKHNHAYHDQMIALIPGADVALHQWAEQGVPMGVVTSKRLDMTKRGLQQYGLWSLFQTVVHHDSTSRHKPDPEPLQCALANLKARPEDTWYIGDSPYDMRAARAAQCEAVGFSYNTFKAEELVAAGAGHWVQSWSELYSWWEINHHKSEG